MLPKGRKSISARFPCRSVSWEIFESAHDMRVDGLSGGVTIDEAFASVRPAVTGCWRFFVNVFCQRRSINASLLTGVIWNRNSYQLKFPLGI